MGDIYNDTARLLVNLKYEDVDLPSASKGSLIAETLMQFREFGVFASGAIRSTTFNHKEIFFTGSDDVVLAKYSYDQLPEFNSKIELAEFIASLLKNIDYA